MASNNATMRPAWLWVPGTRVFVKVLCSMGMEQGARSLVMEEPKAKITASQEMVIYGTEEPVKMEKVSSRQKRD